MLSPSPAEPDFAFSGSPRWGLGPNPWRRPAGARGRRGDVSAASEAARAAVTAAQPWAARAHAPLRQQRAWAVAGRGRGERTSGRSAPSAGALRVTAKRFLLDACRS